MTITFNFANVLLAAYSSNIQFEYSGMMNLAHNEIAYNYTMYIDACELCFCTRAQKPIT